MDETSIVSLVPSWIFNNIIQRTISDGLVDELIGSRENMSKVASVKCGSTLSTATEDINVRTKIVSYADAVMTGRIGNEESRTLGRLSRLSNR
jgi:hypothetical protein